MVEIRIANENDNIGWNEVAHQSPEATYAHTWEWKEIIEKLGIKTLYLIAEEEKKIVGIYPAYIKSASVENCFLKLLIGNIINIAWSPLDLTWDYGGPCVLSNTKKEVIEGLINEMERLARRNGCFSIRVSEFKNNEVNKVMLENNYRQSARQTFIIDLSLDEDKIWTNVDKRTRKYVKAAINNNVTVKEVFQENEIKEIYKCISHTHNRVGAYTPPLEFFLQINEKLGRKGVSRFRAALFEGKIIGGDLLFCFNGHVVERYRGIYDEYLELRTNYLMVWTAIEESKKMGYSRYDLGDVSPEAEGIYFFKSRWRGELINTNWYSKDIKFLRLIKFKHKLIG